MDEPSKKTNLLGEDARRALNKIDIPVDSLSSLEPAERNKAGDTANYLRSILKATRDGFCVVDMNGRILDVNDAYCEMCGYSREEFLQLSILDLDADETPQRPAARLKEIKSVGHALFETHNRRKDGTVFEVEVSASFLGAEVDKIVAFYRDISERTRAEEATRESRELFLSSIQALPYPFAIINADTYEVEFANAAFGGRDTVGTKCHYSLYGSETPCSDPMHPCPIKMIKEQGQPASVLHVEQDERGEPQYSEITTYPIYAADGRLIRIAESRIDITERRQAEEKIQRQLAEKEALLKEVHHRIKNNMAQVEGLLTLQAESSDNPEVQAALREAMSRVQSIRVLYEKLLVGEDYQDVSVKDYIESLLDFLVVVVPEHENIFIEKSIADFTLSSKKLIPVGIIINELLTNVFKYSFPGKAHGHVVVELRKTETHATLTIHDNGRGLDAGSTPSGSTGFGLTIVEMLVEQLKGSYSVETDTGRRSVVEFEL